MAEGARAAISDDRTEDMTPTEVAKLQLKVVFFCTCVDISICITLQYIHVDLKKNPSRNNIMVYNEES